MTAAEWAAEWAACVDTAKPGIFTETGTSDCISFTSNLNSIRVRTPDIPWKSTFAQVLGFNEVNTNAFAEVETELAANGGVLPFGMPGGATGSIEICLKSGSNPNNISPCDGPVAGNFGFLDFTQFGDPRTGIPAVCNGGNDRLENNIARGIDHPLGETAVYPGAPSNRERDACNDGAFNANPYHVDSNTGNVAQALDDGFVDGTAAGYPGRLTLGTNVKANVRGTMLDDRPLWTYLNPAGETLCGLISSFTDHTQLTACLGDIANYDAFGDWDQGEIFFENIKESPRFGWVPFLHDPSFGPGSTELTIADYQPVFVQTTFWKCNAGGCALIWNPGDGDAPGPGNQRVEAATAIAIPELALDEDLRDVAPGTDGQVSFLLSR